MCSCVKRGSGAVARFWEDSRAVEVDYWRHGVEENATSVEPMLEYAYDQGLTSRRLRLEGIFAPSTCELSKLQRTPDSTSVRVREVSGMASRPAKGLERMAQLFECFVEAPEWGVSELAARLGEPKSVIHRSVATLAAHHYLEQDPVTKRYRLGLMLMRLGFLAAQRNDLRNIAHPIMVSLVAKTGETALLSVFSGNASVCIDKVDAEQRIRLFYEVGSMNPPVVGVAARTILAFLPPERVQQIVKEVPLRRYTDNTIVDVNKLMADSRETRARGYCITVGEMNEGLFGVGAPIFGPDNQVAASVSIIALKERVSGNRIDELISSVTEAAKLISDHLGFVGRR